MWFLSSEYWTMFQASFQFVSVMMKVKFVTYINMYVRMYQLFNKCNFTRVQMLSFILSSCSCYGIIFFLAICLPLYGTPVNFVDGIAVYEYNS